MEQKKEKKLGPSEILLDLFFVAAKMKLFFVVGRHQMVAIFPYLDMYFCVATKWTRHLGFLVTYSALLMKTWRLVRP